MLGTDGATGGDVASSGTSGLGDSQPLLSSSALRCMSLLRISLRSDLGFPQEKQETPEIGCPCHVPASVFGPLLVVMHAESKPSPRVMCVIC